MWRGGVDGGEVKSLQFNDVVWYESSIALKKHLFAFASVVSSHLAASPRCFHRHRPCHHIERFNDPQ